ncbi:PREDICTED: uncharacterized protein LOC107354137 isoform X4 [Acropora digitifera]|uniref:uncharacterized protein LOC107354137 isoform X4 n=1 Tax=Acropora digitifera TaxID=70779 RepID=UPI00077A5CB8|nr:PREDICTED: uncharacterized protein LOC107354137 isoform X4 [Acropora digitifera]
MATLPAPHVPRHRKAKKAVSSPISALKVTLLSSEWRSTKGCLSTINRELAIHLAKHSNVEVSMYLPQCSEEDKIAAALHNVYIIEAEEIPGYDPIDWLATIPIDHQMDFVIGHGIHLGRQVPHIKRVHRECKWIQVIHSDPEELGMFKTYADSIAKGEKKHQAEVGLCKLADQVVAIGPKLAEAFSRYLQSCGKDQEVLNLTPGIFSEFADVTQAAEERGRFHVLVFGRGDREDFYLKGYDIAARAVAELCKHEPHLFKLVFVGASKGEEEKVKEMLLKQGIAASQLIVRSYKERGELAAQFCEADLAIMPSRSEGFGLAALEALSAGLPVLVSGNSGFGDALKELPFGSSCVVNSEEPSEWAKAIHTIHDKKRKLRLKEAVKIRESYAEEYHWEGECGRLVERMLNIIEGTQGKQPATKTTRQDSLFKGKRCEIAMRSETCVEPTHSGIFYAVSPERQSAEKHGKRPALVHLSGSPPGKKQRRGTDTFRGTQGKQPATKTVRQHSLFTSKQSEFSMRSETFVEPTQSGFFYAVPSEGQSVGKQGRRPLHFHLSATPPVKKQTRDTDIRRVSSDGRSVLKQERRPSHLHPSATPPVMEQRHDTDIRRETSTAPDQAVAEVNLGEQRPSSVSESVSYPDATTIHHIVGDAVSAGRENVIQDERPRTYPLTTTVGRQGLNAGISEISSERQSTEKQGKRPALAHLSGSPAGKKQRDDTDTFRVLNDIAIVVKLLRAEYNRRAQLRPLLWDSTIQLPLEKVYTRLKIVSRQGGGNQGKTECWGDAIWNEDSRRDEIWAEARANKANPFDVFAKLKENKDVMVIVEGNPGIGKTTFCLKLACDWANQSSSPESCPEFELVLLLKCRDIDGDLTEAITEQLFPKDMNKDAREDLFRFMEDIENQERVLIILDGLDELPEKSKHYVDDLLHRKRWACCYVLVTTRQEKGIEVRKQPEFVFNLFLQIQGFNEKDSFEYIRRHFKIAGPEQSSKGEKLIEEIKDNALLQDLQTNPLNLLLLCVVYEDHEGQLPSSRTDLYHVIVVCLLRRYCAKHNVKASKRDRDLETQFERDILCLGELAWNCLLNDRHSFFEEGLEELESRNEKLVVRELGFVYKEESVKRLKPQHEYCFLHKSFEEYLAASYISHQLRRNKFNIFEHLNFNAVVKKFPQVFVFVCGILREEASILFAQIGEKLKTQLKSDSYWRTCSEAAANFFIESWSESGNAEEMANTFCSFMPFPRVVRLSCHYDFENEHWNLLRVLLFCRRFSKVGEPDKIYLKVSSSVSVVCESIKNRDLGFPNLKALHFSDCDMDAELAHELFQSLPDFASLTELTLPDVPEMTDWGIVTKALTTSKTLKTVGCILLGERGESWARALDAGLCADTPLSSVNLTICGPMSETGLQALENLLLNKSLSSVSVTVAENMSYSLAVTLERCLTGQTAVKSLELRVNGKLSFCCANLIGRAIVKNNSLSKLLVSLHGELPDNWQAIVENLNVRLTEKSTLSFEIYPNSFSQVTATQLTDLRLVCVKMYGFFEQKSVTLNFWGELTVGGADAIYSVLSWPWVCQLTLNIHGQLSDDFLHSTARLVDKQKPLCPITINTWNQLTNERKALFKQLVSDKNSAVTLNVCEVHVPSDESGDDKIESIDNPASLITLLEEAKNTGKENLRVRINVHTGDSTCDDSDDSSCDESDDSSCDDSEDPTDRSWKDSLHLGLARNCTLTSLDLTINNFRPRSTKLSLALIDCLEGCSSLKSLTLTLNEYSEWKNDYASLLRERLGRNTSLSSLTLTFNFYTRVIYDDSCFEFDIDRFAPNTSMKSFTLTINDFSSSGDCGLPSSVLWPNYKSLTTFDLTLNNCAEGTGNDLLDFLDVVMKVDSLRTLRLKINDSRSRSAYLQSDFSEMVEKSPSLELIELTISCYGVGASSPETLKWGKTVTTDKLKSANPR